MDQKIVIKKLGFAALIIVLLLIFLSSIRTKEEDKQKSSIIVSPLSLEDMNQSVDRSEINYDNPSQKEREYLKKAYGDTVAFTTKGTIVYYEKAFSGKIKKIITSTWPEDEIVNSIPEVDFGTLERVEYADSYARVYLHKVKNGDLSDYAKQLKKMGYSETSKKVDTESMIRYQFANEEGNRVIMSFFKEDKKCEIYLMK